MSQFSHNSTVSTVVGRACQCGVIGLYHLTICVAPLNGNHCTYKHLLHVRCLSIHILLTNHDRDRRYSLILQELQKRPMLYRRFITENTPWGNNLGGWPQIIANRTVNYCRDKQLWYQYIKSTGEIKCKKATSVTQQYDKESGV